MKIRATQMTFTSGRKLALGLALVVGMVGCKKKEPAIDVVSFDEYELGGKKLLETTHVFHGGGEQKLTWSLVNNGTESIITECTFTPSFDHAGTTVKTILLNDGQFFCGDCKVQNFQGSSSTIRSNCAAPKDLAITCSSHESVNQSIPQRPDDTLYCGVYAPQYKAWRTNGNYKAQLEDSKKFPTHFFLLLRTTSVLVAPSPLQGSKN